LKSPTDAIFWTSLAILLYQQGNYTESFEAIIKATTQKPELYEIWYNLGILYEKCKQPEEALIAYNKVFEMQPGQIDTQRKIASLKGEPNPSESISVVMKNGQQQI
jgi:tetratricopeptide (TPR) repeat protein